MAELLALAKSWAHERDRGWIETPFGSGNWYMLWDSNCHETCKRCQLEKLLEKLNKKL